MSKQLIERLRGFKDTPRTADNLCHEAADRIEELERANQHLIMALADAEALEIGTAERCDTLQADNARLRDVMYRIAFSMVGQCESIAQELFDREAWAAEALITTPEQSLAEYRNKVIEECAKRAEAYAYMSQNFNALAEELRAMKEQP